MVAAAADAFTASCLLAAAWSCDTAASSVDATWRSRMATRPRMPRQVVAQSDACGPPAPEAANSEAPVASAAIERRPETTARSVLNVVAVASFVPGCDAVPVPQPAARITSADATTALPHVDTGRVYGPGPGPARRR